MNRSPLHHVTVATAPWLAALVVGSQQACHEGTFGRPIGGACSEDDPRVEAYRCAFERCRASCASDAECP